MAKALCLTFLLSLLLPRWAIAQQPIAPVPAYNSSGLWLTDVKVCEFVPWLSHRESFISGIKDWLCDRD